MDNQNPTQQNETTFTKVNLDQYRNNVDVTTPGQINNRNIQTKPDDTQISEEKIYTAKKSLPKPLRKKSTKFGSSFMITNICLGTTIFTFGKRAKAFWLVWLLVFCVVVAVINYWSIMRCVYASEKCEEDDFSEITEKLLGRKIWNLLNVIIIIYSYASLMCFIALIYTLFGRFIQSAFYRNDYVDYDDFYDKKWGRLYLKFPFL